MSAKIMRASSLQRKLSAEMAGGAKLLRGPQALETKALHNARKALKRARAGLRLMRDAGDSAIYASYNGRLRDAATSLSKLRDDAVLLEKLREMRNEAGDAEGKLVDFLETELVTEQKRRLAEATNEKLPARAADAIAKVAHEIERRSFAKADASVITAGLKRIYRKGRTAMKLAAKRPDADRLHEARKQAKYLLNAVAMLTSDGGTGSKEIIKRSETVGNKLGDDHDLVLLEARLKKAGGDEFNGGREALLKGIRTRRRKLQKKALKQGQALYRKKPNAFVDLLK